MSKARAKSPFQLTYQQRQTLGRLDYKLSPYLYISPFFILFALIGIFPLIYTFYVSMFKWPLLQGQGAFNFPENYTNVLNDSFFWNSIFNTFSIFLISIIPQVVMALIIAGFLDQNIRAKTFWRMSVFLPFIVSPVAVALIFTNMFSEQYGLVNNLLAQFGLDPVAWKTAVFPSHFAIATMVNWRWTGYNTLVLLAAMQAVPRDIYEASEMDGAGPIRRYLSVTIPSIRPTVLFVIITATIGGMQIFAEPRLYNDPMAVNPGGNFRQYETAVLYIWDMAFLRQNFGRASAIAILLFFIIVSVALINFIIATRLAITRDPRPNRPKRPLIGVKPLSVGSRVSRSEKELATAGTGGRADSRGENVGARS